MNPPTPAGESVVLGLVGRDIGGSLTPAMHEREGRALGLSLAYRPIDAAVLGFGVDDLSELLTWAHRFGFAGLNVTHPFKQAIMPLLDRLTPDADDLGAVNTVLITDDGLLGANTDWQGYQRSLLRVLPGGASDRVLVLGAGGAGSAVGYALLHQGAEHVSLFDLDRDRAEACVVRLAKVYGESRVDVADDPAAALARCRGLVNATAVGMSGHEGMPLAAELVRSDLWVSDVVYFPLRTALINTAAANGCTVISGGGMAVYQAVEAFRLFTGRDPDPERMLRHFAELTQDVHPR